MAERGNGRCSWPAKAAAAAEPSTESIGEPDSTTIRFTCSTLGGSSASVELRVDALVLEAKRSAAPDLGIPALEMSLFHSGQLLDDRANLKAAGITDGAALVATYDPFVLMYEQEVGIFSNQNDGKGRSGHGTRLDLSKDCERREAAADEDTPDTRCVFLHAGEQEDRAPVRMGHRVAILNEARTKRVDLGLRMDPAFLDNSNTRLVIKRLDGPSEGPISYSHKLGIFSQDGSKRLEMSTMGNPNHESWATQLYILVLEGGELVHDDVGCPHTIS